MRSFFIPFLIAGAVVCAAPSSRSATENEEAKKQLENGKQLLAQGELIPAQNAFKRSYELNNNAEALFGLGRVEAGLGNNEQALSYLSRCLQEGGTKLPPNVRLMVQQDIARLQALAAESLAAQAPLQKAPDPSLSLSQAASKKNAEVHVQNALNSERQGQLAPAKAELEKAYSIFPDPETLYQLARIETKLGAPDKAISLLKRYMADSKGSLPPSRQGEAQREIDRLNGILARAAAQQEAARIFEQGRALFAQGNFKQAAPLLDKAYTLYPNYEYLYYGGITAGRLGQSQVAIDSLNRYLREGGNRIGLSQREDVSRELRQLAEASQQAAKKATAQNDFDQGKSWFSAGDYERAIALYEQAYKTYPNYEIFFSVGEAEAKLAHNTKAREAYERYLREGGTNVPVARQVEAKKEIDQLIKAEATDKAKKEAADLHKRGLALTKERRYEEALIEFERAYQLHQDYRILRGIGNAAAKLDRYPAAIAAYERYLKDGGNELDPEKRVVVEQDLEWLKVAKQAHEDYDNSKYDRALPGFEKAFELHQNGDFLYYIGKSATSTGEKEKALDAYRRYLKSGKDIDRGRRGEVKGEIKRLEGELENAAKKEEARVLVQEGQTWFRDKNYQQAAELFTKAYKLDPQFEIQLNLSEAEEQAARYTEAREALERFLREGGGKIPENQQNKARKDLARLKKLEADDKAKNQAVEIHKKGLELSQKGRYKEALVEFDKAYKLHEDYRILRGRGNAAAELSLYGDAIDAYTRYLRDGGKNLEPGKRIKVEQAIEWLRLAKEGQELYEAKKYERSLGAYQKAYQLNQSANFLYFIGKNSALLSQDQQALKAFQDYLEKGGDRIEKTKAAEAQKEIERLKGVLDRAAKKEQARVLFEQGQKQYQNGENEQAVTSFEQSYKLDPRVEVLLGLGQAHDKAKNYTEARETYERYLRQGGAGISAKQQKETKQDIARLIGLEAKNKAKKQAVALYKKGLKLNAAQRYKEAIGEFDRSYQLYPDYRIQRGLGEAAAHLGFYDKAIAAWERYLSEGGDRVSPGDHDRVRTDIEAARAAIEQAKKKQQALLLFNEGQSLSLRGSFDQALTKFESAYDLFPEYKILYSIAETQERLKQNEQAIDTYQRYLTEGGEKISASQRTSVNEQINVLRTRISTNENRENAKGRFNEGLALKAKKQYEEAVGEFEEAYKLDPNYEILLPMADCQARLGNNEEALKTYSLYLAKGGARIPNNKRAEINREKERLYKLTKKKQ